jgi:alkanesulfonate monooxygenase SsuD/methylene tetrahydromethanopterin reductase-like flavin-dependent oxidoreductase (luciferase family)
MGVAGPRGAEAAGRVADGIIIGTGADAVAIEALRSRALAAHSRAQRTTPFEVWGEVSLNVVERAADITAAREQMLGHAVGHSRHSFSWTFEDKNVPVEFQSDMRELYPQYQFSHHASRDGNLNASLFANHPRLRDYIIDRFSIIGTPQQCKERLIQFIEEGRLDGVYLPINLPNAVQVVRRAADAFGDLLNT